MSKNNTIGQPLIPQNAEQKKNNDDHQDDGKENQNQNQNKMHPYDMDVNDSTALEYYGEDKKFIYLVAKKRKDDEKQNKINEDENKNKIIEDENKNTIIEDEITVNIIELEKKNPWVRELYIGVKVLDIYNIDDEDDCFHIRYHIWISYIATKEERDRYEQWNKLEDDRKKLMKDARVSFEKKLKEQNSDSCLMDEAHKNKVFEKYKKKDWMPSELPEFELRHAREYKLTSERWEIKPYKITHDRNGNEKDVYIDNKNSIPEKIQKHKEKHNKKIKLFVIRGKIVIDATLDETFEMKNYPFDCQDLTCILRELSGGFKILPELRTKTFAASEETCTAVQDFNVAGFVLELGDFMSGTREKRPMHGIVLSIKMKRRWVDILLAQPLVMFLLSTLSIAVFIGIDSYEERLNSMLTLILTAIASNLKSKAKPYLTLLDYYKLFNFMYLVIGTLLFAIAGHDNNPEYINMILYFFWITVYVILQLSFLIYSYKKKKSEEQKIYCTYDKTMDHNNEDIATVDSNYSNFIHKVFKDKDDNNKSLLSYFGILCNRNTQKQANHQNNEIQKFFDHSGKSGEPGCHLNLYRNMDQTN